MINEHHYLKTKVEQIRAQKGLNEAIEFLESEYKHSQSAAILLKQLYVLSQKEDRELLKVSKKKLRKVDPSHRTKKE